jgi:hypothetical protein
MISGAVDANPSELAAGVAGIAVGICIGSSGPRVESSSSSSKSGAGVCGMIEGYTDGMIGGADDMYGSEVVLDPLERPLPLIMVHRHNAAMSATTTMITSFCLDGAIMFYRTKKNWRKELKDVRKVVAGHG